ARLEEAVSAGGALRPDLFALVGQVAIAVAIDVQDVTICNQPDAEVGPGPENKQAVPGAVPVCRLLAERALDLRQVGGGNAARQQGRGEHQAEHGTPLGSGLEVV